MIKNYKFFQCKCEPSVLIKIYSSKSNNFVAYMAGYTLRLSINGKDKSALEIKQALNLTEDKKIAIMKEAEIIIIEKSISNLTEIME